MEKESSEWQLQGQPTVLLTLAHIFHRFAPLLVRGHSGGEEAAVVEAPVLGTGMPRCVRSALHLARAPCDQSPQTSRVSPSKGRDTSS